MKMNFSERVEHLIEAGFQALYIATAERGRCEDELAKVAENIGLEFITWDGVAGFSVKDDVKDPIEALLSLDGEQNPIWKGRNNILFVFRNLHVYLEDPGVRQAFQNLYYSRLLSNPDCKRPLVILSNTLQINAEIAPCISVVEFTLPDEKQLDTIFKEVEAGIEIDASRPGAVAKYNKEMQSRVVQAMRGLTTLEAENVLSYSLRVARGFSPELIDTIEDQKASALEKSEVLTYVPKDRIATMDQIGGYEELKEFIAQRKLAYTKAAREVGLDLPRGIALIGPPGTGKSIVGKVIARELQLPLVIFNFANVFGSLVGESERKMRTALNTIDALDGAVALIDEGDKALGGANDSSGDSGVTRRVFGQLLTWLTEKTSSTFMVMTMNRTKGIPSEFLRKGRWDEVFYTDLPDAVEREQILEIHLKKRGVDIKPLLKADKTWADLLAATDRFVGSELEQIVCDARFISFANRKSGQPTADELIECAKKIVPLADSEKDNIDEIRRMCEGRARPVSKQRKTTTTKPKSRQTTLA